MRPRQQTARIGCNLIDQSNVGATTGTMRPLVQSQSQEMHGLVVDDMGVVVARGVLATRYFAQRFMCNTTSTYCGVRFNTSLHLLLKLGCSSDFYVARSLTSSLQRTSLPHSPIERNKYSSRRMMSVEKSFSVQPYSSEGIAVYFPIHKVLVSDFCETVPVPTDPSQ